MLFNRVSQVPHPQALARLVEVSVYALLEVGLGEVLLELVPEEGVGRVAGRGEEEIVLVVLDHGEESVAGGRAEVEVVVVDHDVHLAPESREVTVKVGSELVGLLLGTYVHPLKVRVDDVILCVVGDTLVEAHGRALLEAHLPFHEDPSIHRADIVGDDGPEGHLGEYVPPQDYPGGYLDDLKPSFDELEDAPLRYVVDALPAPPRVLAGECDLSHLIHKLARARLYYLEVAVLDG